MVPIPSQAAILRAAKAVPGGARPTPAPQGSGDVGPYFGRISPLAAELANERGYANAYSPFLPRPARTFTEGAFGPFSPILPVPVDAPAPGADLPDPRRFDYPVGWNLPSIPGQDGFRLASFATLETLSRLYSVARTCIQRRKMTIGGLEWDIVPTKEAAKAYQGDHAAMRDFGERRSEAVRFFGKPDPNYFSFDSFMSALLEQVFVFDALSLVMRPKRGRGLHKGILGSDLDCLELIDGQTIRPLLGLHGEMPRPPAPYVQQYIQGVPRSDFQSMWDGRDIEEAGLKGYEGPAFSSDQLLYLPTVPRANSPYGMSAVEMALVVIMTGLQKQAYQLNYYNEGTVPAVYISPGDMTMTPAQIRELQGALNGFASDQAWHHKIIVTPPGSKIDPQRPASLADQFDEIIMASVAMVFDVDPMSLGIIPAVSTAVSPFAAKEMAESSRTVHERTSTKPLLKFLASIANSLLHRVMSQDDMKFTFSGMDEANDQAAQTDMLVKQVQSGLISIDEAREELQRTAWGLDETSGPLVFTQMGPVPLNQVIEMMRQQQPMQGGQTAAANSGNSVTASHQPRAVHHPPSSRPVGTHNPRLGLPAGSGGADLAPSPGGASDTPAHAAARAHQAAGKRKAVMAELEALARQVRKGRHIATWIPEHIPGVIMASLAEDLTKGIGIDEAVRDALALPEDAYEWVEKAGPQQNQSQRQQAQALAQQYAAQVRAVFGQVAAQAARLIAQWLSGALAVTAAALAAMITALLAKLLEPVLRRLWADAWALGRDTAAGILGAEAPSGSDDDAAFQAWADSHGRDWLEQITTTHEDDVAAGLYEAGSAGEDAETIASRIGDWLDAAGRSVLIAVDQVQRAFAAAMAAVARKLGVMQKSWITRNDAKVCFPGGTPIATPGGPVPIERLRPGDLVITPQGQRPVRATMARPYAGGLTAITAEGRTVTATDNHPFMTIAGWREASDLKPGDFLKTRGDQVAEITSVVHLALAKPDHVPAHRGKSLIPGGVLLGRPLMPVFAVGFDGHAGVRKGEVDRPLADVEFLRERDPEQREGLPDAELQEGLARVPAIAATGAELALSVGSIGPRPELGAAGLAGHVDGGTPALLGAEVSVEVLLGTKPLAAPLAVDVHGVSGLAGVRADSVAVRDGLRDLEVLSAGRAVPGDPAAGDAAFQGAVFAGPVPALLGRVEDLPAARAFPALVDDGSGAIEALRGAEAALAPESLTTHEDFSAFIAGVRKGHRNGVSTSYVNGGNSLIVYNVMVEDEHVYYANDFLVHNCGKCKANQAQGWVNFGSPYPSGQLSPPGHPRCRCHEDYRVSLNPAQKFAGGRRYVDLPGQEWWPADSYPSGPATGGGGPMHAAHDADDIQQYVPGGVPGMTAGGEPPRWPGSEAEALVTVSPGTDSAGRGNVPTRGGGTAGGPYRDFSGETHNDAPQDADDAAWPGERAVGPVAGRSWPLQGYGGGYWPQGGHGTAQAPVTSIGATERGRPPNAVGKGAADLSDPNPVDSTHILSIMRANFPESALGWVSRARWIGPCEVPWERINTAAIDSWAASHEPATVDRFAREIKAGTGHLEPSILIQRPDDDKCDAVDGHHRAVARHQLGRPVLAYVGFVHGNDVQAALETHSSQVHSGSDPANKAASAAPVAAGLAVRAADTGRILMLQRAIADDDDPAAGFWEFPGGRLDGGEEALDAARREWAEETGCQVPDGDLTGIWNASNGRYRGFVLTVPSEAEVDIFGDRDDVSNPDDPDRDAIEALAWWDPGMLKDNPALRPELAEDSKRVRRALKSAQTPVVSTVHHPLGHEGLWHTPDRHVSSVQQLPAYFENTARALMRDEGMGESQAIATAVNAVREWAEGHAFGGKVKVTPEVQEAAQRAMAEWAQLRASHDG